MQFIKILERVKYRYSKCLVKAGERSLITYPKRNTWFTLVSITELNNIAMIDIHNITPPELDITKLGDRITIKGVTFTKSNEWRITFPKGILMTPIWKRGKIVRLLVTNRVDGSTTYYDCSKSMIELRIYTIATVIYLPQGVSFIYYEPCVLEILCSSITLSKP